MGSALQTSENPLSLWQFQQKTEATGWCTIWLYSVVWLGSTHAQTFFPQEFQKHYFIVCVSKRQGFRTEISSTINSKSGKKHPFGKLNTCSSYTPFLKITYFYSHSWPGSGISLPEPPERIPLWPLPYSRGRGRHSSRVQDLQRFHPGTVGEWNIQSQPLPGPPDTFKQVWVFSF